MSSSPPQVNRFAITGDPVFAIATVAASGGFGGSGGAGGAGGDSFCVSCDDNEWTVDGGPGSSGGTGGRGGDGGRIDVTVAQDASLVAAHLRTDGGSGLSAGTSGASGTSIAGVCSGLPDCPDDYFAFGGVPGAAAGNGGAAGPITIAGTSSEGRPRSAAKGPTRASACDGRKGRRGM